MRSEIGGLNDTLRRRGGASRTGRGVRGETELTEISDISALKVGANVLVRLESEWRKARITRRCSDGSFDIQTIPEGRYIADVSATCIRLPPRVNPAALRRDLLSTLWYEHWGNFLAASVWTSFAHALALVVFFYIRLPYDIVSMSLPYALTMLLLFGAKRWAKRSSCISNEMYAYRCAPIVNILSFAISFVFAIFIVYFTVRNLLLATIDDESEETIDTDDNGNGSMLLLLLIGGPLEILRGLRILFTPTALFCIAQGSILWFHAITGVLVSCERRNLYSFPVWIVRILFHPTSVGVYLGYMVSAIVCLRSIPHRPTALTLVRDGICAGVVKYAVSVRLESFVLCFPRLQRGRILQVWERAPLIVQQAVFETAITMLLAVVTDQVFVADNMSEGSSIWVWKMRALLLVHLCWTYGQHALEIFLTTPMRRMTLEHAVAALSLASSGTVAGEFARYDDDVDFDERGSASDEGDVVTFRNGVPVASFASPHGKGRGGTVESEWRFVNRQLSLRYETIALRLMSRTLRNSFEAYKVCRPSLLLCHNGRGAAQSKLSLHQSMLRRHALRLLLEKARLDRFARAAIFGANDGELWRQTRQRLTAIIDAMTLSLQMSARPFAHYSTVAKVVGATMDKEASEKTSRANLDLGMHEDVRTARRRKLLRRTRCPDFATPFMMEMSPAKLYLEGLPEMRPTWPCFRRRARVVCQSLFADTQSVDSAAQTLALLVAAAHSEDSAGRVKSSVPAVLTSLLGCLCALEDFVQSPLFLARESPIKASELRLEGHQLLRSYPDALASSVTRAICRICTTYGNDMRGFSLAPAYTIRLRPFLEGMGIVENAERP